jgi:hypothetical protein
MRCADVDSAGLRLGAAPLLCLAAVCLNLPTSLLPVQQPYVLAAMHCGSLWLLAGIDVGAARACALQENAACSGQYQYHCK